MNFMIICYICISNCRKCCADRSHLTIESQTDVYFCHNNVKSDKNCPYFIITSHFKIEKTENTKYMAIGEILRSAFHCFPQEIVDSEFMGLEGQRELLSLHIWPHGAKSVHLFDFTGMSVIITNFHACEFEIKLKYALGAVR